jgi:hypothetical protein
MKRMVMILIAISVMSIAELANAGITDLPSYPRIATLLDNYIISVDVAQVDYFAANNTYFQGLDLVSGQPDGVKNVKSDSTKKPSDQEFSWLDFDPKVFALSVALPVNIKMNVYESQLDWGYTLIFEFWRDDLSTDANGNEGDHWVYMYHVGADPDPVAIYDEWFIQEDSGEAY